MMTSQVLRALEAKGFVRRSRHPSDSRALQLRVTAAGSKLARDAIAAVEAADREFFSRASGTRPIVDFLRDLAG
jgi:DNA-binding MarR family transcriptional regulator